MRQRSGSATRNGSLCATFVMLLLASAGAACGAEADASEDGDAGRAEGSDGRAVNASRSGGVAGGASTALAAASGNGPAAASGNAAASASGNGPASASGNGPATASGNGPAAASGNGPASASGNGPAAASGNGPAAAGGASGSAAASSGASGADPGAAAASGGSPSPTAGAGAASPPAANGGADPASCKGDEPGDPTRQAPVIYVIGDSTASVYESSLYPRMGWAQPLQEYFKEVCATVQDKALSGRSSKSFFDEGAWTPIRAALHEGDFVLIQFGHNDEKRDDAARYTEPFGSYQEQLSTYIDDTLAAKATPILLTSIERNKWSNGKLSATHGDYPEAVRQLAQKRQLTLVDMTQLTHTYLESIGQEAATKLFMNLAAGESPNYPNGNSDDTHLQDKGAHKVADIALADLARQRTPLAALLDRIPSP